MNELISIIIPVYNVEKYICKCIDSIINQSYKNIQIILVDDGSTDKSGYICDRYSKMDTRIQVIHEKNKGQSSARNIGLQISEGNYICFIDADDYVHKDYLIYLLNLILKDNSDMSICNTLDYYKNGKIIGENSDKNMILSPDQALEMMLYQNSFDTGPCAKLYKKDLFDNITFPENQIYEDFEIIYKIIDKCKIISYGKKAMYYYFHHKNSIMTNSFSDKKLHLIEISKEILNFVSNKYPQIKNAAVRRYVYSNHHLLNLMCNSKNYSKSLKNQFIKNIKTNAGVVLFDKKSSKKDKIAIICLYLGFPFYRFCFKLMKKFNNTNI
ncbi:glycosyltransferase family 2 protein [uncultured Clostridium sp.]|uniref:glycosyltransferase family 2 protein n=1 Tax=uncultured Clostridium sp. TaxID=59620 RepID=UPI0025E280A5|nr:glycosyltransferase family 2 protein [uncultured Clostridium sp.]